MVPEEGEASFRSFLSSYDGDSSGVDSPHILQGLTAFLVRSFDGAALQSSFPLLVYHNLPGETDLSPAGSDGAVCALIEYIKERAMAFPELGRLYGRGTQNRNQEMPHRRGRSPKEC